MINKTVWRAAVCKESVGYYGILTGNIHHPDALVLVTWETVVCLHEPSVSWETKWALEQKGWSITPLNVGDKIEIGILKILK